MQASNLLAVTPEPEKPEQQPNAAEFVDAIGDRAHVFQHRSASWLAVLRFKREFSDAPSFEAALRKRVEELKTFRHAAVAPVRGVERLVTGGELVLLADRVAGHRLSDLIKDATGPEFAMELVGQLAPALAALQNHGTGLSHGLVTPDRIVVTHEGQLVLTETPVSAAMNVLHLPAQRVRTELQVAVAPGANVNMFDGTADVLQLGFVALSMLLGRRLAAEDYPASLQTWMRDLEARAADHFAVPPALADWLERALQLDHNKFASPQAALDAFAKVRRAGPTVVVGLPPVPVEGPEPFTTTDEDVEAALRGAASEKVVGKEGANDFPTETAKDVVREVAKDIPREVLKEAPKEVAKEALRDVAKAVVTPEAVAAKPVAEKRVAEKVVAEKIVAERVVAEKVSPEKTAATVPIAEKPRANGPSPERSSSPKPSTQIHAVPAVAPLPVPQVHAPSAVVTGSQTRRPALAATLAGVFGAISVIEAVAIVMLMGSPVTPTVVSPASATAAAASFPSGSSLSPEALTAAVAAAAPVSGVSAPTPAPVETLPPAPAGGRFGGLKVNSAFDLQAFENGQPVGSSSGPIALAEGKHTIELANETLGFRTRANVDVKAGQMTALSLPVPNGRLSINASPWASVLIDGAPAGDTPIANLEIPIGTHDVVFRHPQFGEQRQRIVVKVEGMARVGATMEPRAAGSDR